MKLLMMSDVHLCHQNWYGVSSPERMHKMIADLNRAYEQEAYEAILFLGDYSLDHWGWDCGGSYPHHKISNTANLKEDYLSKLICKQYYMIPGNHEQYGDAKWQEITGMHRQFSMVLGGALFLMLDNFSKDLDPKTDSDGTYTSPDLGFIHSEMDKYPNMPTILCAHFFDQKQDSVEFKTFLREEKRVVCLFCGHDQSCQTEEYEGKLLFHDGNYSYALNEFVDDMWGWREVYLQDDRLKTVYFTPETEVHTDGGTISCKDSRKEARIVPFVK